MSPFLTISVLGPGIPSVVGDTEPAIPMQIARYMNAGFNEKADKFKLVSALVMLYHNCNEAKS